MKFCLSVFHCFQFCQFSLSQSSFCLFFRRCIAKNIALRLLLVRASGFDEYCYEAKFVRSWQLCPGPDMAMTALTTISKPWQRGHPALWAPFNINIKQRQKSSQDDTFQLDNENQVFAETCVLRQVGRELGVKKWTLIFWCFLRRQFLGRYQKFWLFQTKIQSRYVCRL